MRDRARRNRWRQGGGPGGQDVPAQPGPGDRMAAGRDAIVRKCVEARPGQGALQGRRYGSGPEREPSRHPL